MGRDEPPGGTERHGLTLREWLDHAAAELTRAGVETPSVDARLILCHVLACDRAHLLAHPTDRLDPHDLTRADALLSRRARREPLPHLLGEWEFMGHRYVVGPQALIPRPETEVLVEAVVERLREALPSTGLTPRPPSLQGKGEPDDADGCVFAPPSPCGRGAGGEACVPYPATEFKTGEVVETRSDVPFTGLTPRPPSPPGKGEPDSADSRELSHPSPHGRGAGGESRVPQRVLDIGAGTGCIAIELALGLPDATVTSIDISRSALELAARNVARFALADRVTLREARFPDEATDLGFFDAIVSNPPYIPSDAVDRLAPELTQFEPRTALDGGSDGLDVIRGLVSESQRYLRPGGMLAMEIGHDQAESVVHFLGAAGWGEVEVIADLAGIQRVVLARLPI